MWRNTPSLRIQVVRHLQVLSFMLLASGADGFLDLPCVDAPWLAAVVLRTATAVILTMILFVTLAG